MNKKNPQGNRTYYSIEYRRLDIDNKKKSEQNEKYKKIYKQNQSDNDKIMSQKIIIIITNEIINK